MTETLTGPVKYGDTYQCGCGEDMEIERLDPGAMIQVWACPEGHRYVRDFGEREDGQPQWRQLD